MGGIAPMRELLSLGHSNSNPAVLNSALSDLNPAPQLTHLKPLN